MEGNCQIPTPLQYVKILLDDVCYRGQLYGKRVLENSCGDGNILEEIIVRYIESAKREKRSSDEIRNGLERDICAYEIDEKCIRRCIDRLDKTAEKYGITQVNWNVRNEDFLTQQQEGMYDFIIGNPPYITYHDMNEMQRELLKKKYRTCAYGRFDYCYAFTEASISDLAPAGRMAYLIPYSIMTNKFAQSLRDFALPYVTEIHDYSTISIFPDAITSSIILICENEKRKPELADYYLEAEGRKIEIRKADLMGKKWTISGETPGNAHRFGEYFEVTNSVATLLNEAFVLKEYDYQEPYYIVGKYRIEKELVKDAASTKSLNKKSGKKDKIIFPYRMETGEATGYTEEEFKRYFPYAMSYMRQFKKRLKERKADKNALWFQYGRSQAIGRIQGEKLIMPMVITKKNHVYHAGEDAVPYAGYFIKCKPESEKNLEEAKEILESREFYEHVKVHGTSTTPTSYRISVNDIKNYVIDAD